MNTLKITALKAQEVTDKYLRDKPYISLFCFTEVKVDCVDFIPIGLELYTKHRKKEKRGGGLAIGHLTDSRIKLEEIKVESNDILILEGTIHSEKVRIILTYMGCIVKKRKEKAMMQIGNYRRGLRNT